jgi:hypothetical protein
MQKKDRSTPSGGSAEHQSGASGNNQPHGHSKPSTPGMMPGIEQQAENARHEEEEPASDVKKEKDRKAF